MSDRRYKVVGSDKKEAANLSWTDVHDLLTEEVDAVKVRAQGKSSKSPFAASTDPGDNKPDYRVRQGEDQVLGPMPVETLVRLLLAGKLRGDEPVQAEGADKWITMASVPALASALRLCEVKDARAGSIAAPLMERGIDRWGVAPLFLDISRKELTGFLTIEMPAARKAVSFLFGRPIQVRSNHPDEFLLELLKEAGRITESHATEALALAKKNDIPVGNALIQLQALTPRQLTEALSKQALTRIQDVLTWSTGTARFDKDLVAGRDDDVLGAPATDLCRDHARRLGDARVLELLGDGKLKILLGETPLQQSSQAELAVYKVVSQAAKAGGLTVDAVVQGLTKSGMPRAEVLLALYMLRAMDSIRLTVPGREGLAGLKERLLRSVVLGALMVGEHATAEEMRKRLDVLRGEVQKAVGALDPKDPDRVALEARLREIGARIEDPIERYVMARAHFMKLDLNDTSVRASLEAEYLERLVRHGVAGGRYKEVVGYAERLAKLTPKDPVALSYHGLAKFYATDSPLQKEAAFDALLKLAEEHAQSVELQVAVSEASMAYGRDNQAKKFYERAVALAPEDARVKRLRSRMREEVKARDEARMSRLADEPVSGGFDIPPLALRALYVYLGLTLVLWLLSCVTGLGENEYFYNGVDPFWWGRRILLVATALVGYVLLFGEGLGGFTKGLFRKPEPVYYGWALVVGVLSGVLSPVQRVTGSAALVIFLTILHVLAEQTFFIAFLMRAFLRVTKGGVGLPAVGLALLFGFYHITYFSFYQETIEMWQPYWMGLIALGAGLPYAALYAKSKSIIPPLLAHLLVNGIMMVHSLIARGG